MDHIIKNCSAPCIRRVTFEEYNARVLEACEFLEGQSQEMLKQIEDEMKKAAENLDFERAAEMRNMLDDLRRTTRPAGALREVHCRHQLIQRRICRTWRMHFSYQDHRR